MEILKIIMFILVNILFLLVMPFLLIFSKRYRKAVADELKQEFKKMKEYFTIID